MLGVMFRMMPRLSVFLCAALLAAPSAFARGQGRVPVQSLNFDLWCQDTARLPVAQCDRRLPEDMQRFEAYRATIERYEIPYLKEQQNQIQLNRAILRSDPVDNPVSKNPQAQSQSTVQPPSQTRP